MLNDAEPRDFAKVCVEIEENLLKTHLPGFETPLVWILSLLALARVFFGTYLGLFLGLLRAKLAKIASSKNLYSLNKSVLEAELLNT